jgi:hypothetical protein
MTSLTDTRVVLPSGRYVIPALTGSLAIGLAIYQVAVPGAPDATFETLLDWVREFLFLGYLLASITATVIAARRGLAPRASMWMIGCGYGAVAIGVAAGMTMREDPEWFFVLGGPGNLLAAAGFVTWAVWAIRRRVLPVLVGLLCGVGGTVAVLGSELGTSVLVGGFWLYVASRGSASRADGLS